MEFVQQAEAGASTESGLMTVLRRLAERHREDRIGEMIRGIENMAFTENGACAYKSSKDAFVDLYYQSVRGVSDEKVRELFERCWHENIYLTLRLCAFIRDCRGGKGERKIGRILFEEVCKKDAEVATKNANLFFSDFGRWDDGIEMHGECVDVYVGAVVEQLRKDLLVLQAEGGEGGEGEGGGVSLCAKWIPSEKNPKHKGIYKKIVKAFGMDYASFRKQVLVPLRRKIDLLETKLCELRYADIDYEKVPSIAMHIHSKKPSGGRRGKHASQGGCFRVRDGERFDAYTAALAKGEKKVNASVLFPHQIVEEYVNGGSRGGVADDLKEAQWKVMLEQMREMGDLSECLVLSDVSGSMSGTPMIVSYTMGILISSLAKSDIWKDMVMTFESVPQLVKIQGETLFEKINSIMAIPWGGSTNFVAAMEVILGLAKQYSLPQSDIPKRLIVVSDMQFNQADGRGGYISTYNLLQTKYQEAGYQLPHIVFWNVRDTRNTPATADMKGVSLVSGFSTRVMQGVLNCKEGEMGTPFDVMMTSIMNERYDEITL